MSGQYVVERLMIGAVRPEEVVAVRMPRARFLGLVDAELDCVAEEWGADVAGRLRDRLVPVARSMPVYPLGEWVTPGRGCGCVVGEYLIAARELDRAMLARTHIDVEDLQGDVPPAFVKTWLPVAVATGKDGEVIEAIAGQSGSPGCKPGEYRPVPAGAWFGGAPRVIEPELG